MEFSVHSLGAPTIRAITRWPEAVVTSGALCFVGSVPATWRAMRFWAVRSIIQSRAGCVWGLEEISKQKKVSLARVVRHAAEKYVADQWSLLRGK